MIEKITIKNYRLFDQLMVEKFGRVNLIVGANNSGKTALLETLYLLANSSPSAALCSILKQREEFSFEHNKKTRQHGIVYDFNRLFPNQEFPFDKIVIEIKDQSDTLRIGYRLDGSFDLHSKDSIFTQPLEESVLASIDNQLWIFIAEKMANQGGYLRGLLGAFESLDTVRTEPKKGAFLINTTLLNPDDFIQLWDEIQLTTKKETVLEVLQLLEPRLIDLGLNKDDQVIVRLKDSAEAIPLGSMGEGMKQLLHLVSALVTVENGVLLVDEIDTGLHYSVLTAMWKRIIETAERENIQLFATTHSWDCVGAFHEAIEETNSQDETLLFRLQRGVNGKSRTVSYTPRQIGIALREGVEIR